MKFENILSDLKEKKYSPVYFLMGEESYFIDKISDYIIHNILDESEKDFNQSVIYGKESSVESVLSKAKQFPLMGEKVVVVVKEAQDLKKLKNCNRMLRILYSLQFLLFVTKTKSLINVKVLRKQLRKKLFFLKVKNSMTIKSPNGFLIM